MLQEQQHLPSPGTVEQQGPNKISISIKRYKNSCFLNTCLPHDFFASVEVETHFLAHIVSRAVNTTV